jgi:nucleoside-diphosphate-sugar epimerase
MDETAQPNPGQLLGWRPEHEQFVLQAAGPNLRTSVIRPGVVYGGNRGIVSDLLKNALNGLIRVIGTGANHWPLVYDRDLADLYVRVASMPNASGIYHANDEGDETVNAIVEGIAGHLSMRPDVRHVPLEEARKKLGAYADALALDQRVRGPARPRARLVSDTALRRHQRAALVGRVPPCTGTRGLSCCLHRKDAGASPRFCGVT